MAVLALSFLKALSVHGAEQLLLQEGYMEEARIERKDAADRAAFFAPYALYDAGGDLLDRIYYIEFCERVLDVEYEDRRKTWEELRGEWSRQGPAL